MIQIDKDILRLLMYLLGFFLLYIGFRKTELQKLEKFLDYCLKNGEQSLINGVRNLFLDAFIIKKNSAFPPLFFETLETQIDFYEKLGKISNNCKITIKGMIRAYKKKD